MKKIFEYYTISGREGGYKITLSVGWKDKKEGLADYTQRTFTDIERWIDVVAIMGDERDRLRKEYSQE